MKHLLIRVGYLKEMIRYMEKAVPAEKYDNSSKEFFVKYLQVNIQLSTADDGKSDRIRVLGIRRIIHIEALFCLRLYLKCDCVRSDCDSNEH